MKRHIQWTYICRYIYVFICMYVYVCWTHMPIIQPYILYSLHTCILAYRCLDRCVVHLRRCSVHTATAGYTTYKKTSLFSCFDFLPDFLLLFSQLSWVWRSSLVALYKKETQCFVVWWSIPWITRKKRMCDQSSLEVLRALNQCRRVVVSFLLSLLFYFSPCKKLRSLRSWSSQITVKDY